MISYWKIFYPARGKGGGGKGVLHYSFRGKKWEGGGALAGVSILREKGKEEVGYPIHGWGKGISSPPTTTGEEGFLLTTFCSSKGFP